MPSLLQSTDETLRASATRSGCRPELIERRDASSAAQQHSEAGPVCVPRCAAPLVYASPARARVGAAHPRVRWLLGEVGRDQADRRVAARRQRVERIRAGISRPSAARTESRCGRPRSLRGRAAADGSRSPGVTKRSGGSAIIGWRGEDLREAAVGVEDDASAGRLAALSDIASTIHPVGDIGALERQDPVTRVVHRTSASTSPVADRVQRFLGLVQPHARNSSMVLCIRSRSTLIARPPVRCRAPRARARGRSGLRSPSGSARGVA